MDKVNKRKIENNKNNSISNVRSSFNILNTSNENKIKDIIEDMKPYLNADGGDIDFIKYEDDYVYVKLFGACSHCGYQDYTLNDGLLELIKEKVPEVKGVINVEI